MHSTFDFSSWSLLVSLYFSHSIKTQVKLYYLFYFLFDGYKSEFYLDYQQFYSGDTGTSKYISCTPA